MMKDLQQGQTQHASCFNCGTPLDGSCDVVCRFPDYFLWSPKEPAPQNAGNGIEGSVPDRPALAAAAPLPDDVAAMVDYLLTPLVRTTALTAPAEMLKRLAREKQAAEKERDTIWDAYTNAMLRIAELEARTVTVPNYIELLKEAQGIVESKSVFKRFIDGTPLANDIAVWMADFAMLTAAPQPSGKEE